jgi:dephospho-CoA kinase
MARIILGLTGLMACGKGTATKYLVAKHQARAFRFSTVFRDVLDRLYIPQSRDNMQKLSLALRQIFGQDLLAETMAKDIAKTKENILVIDGIRRLEDLKYLRKLSNFKVVSLEMAEKLRYARLVSRGENANDKNKTWEQFLKDQQGETELTITEVMKQADVVIDNNGSLEDLSQQLDKLVS